MAPSFAGESAAEAPWQAANNVVSRDSHWTHEGEPSEYDQVRELYTRVMTEEQREHLHKNTAKLLVVSAHFTGMLRSLTLALKVRRTNRSKRLPNPTIRHLPSIRSSNLRSHASGQERRVHYGRSRRRGQDGSFEGQEPELQES